MKTKFYQAGQSQPPPFPLGNKMVGVLYIHVE